jgi:hypothetical protein
MLDLFDGHDTPSMWWEQQNRRHGFYKAIGVTKRLAFEAHLLGAVTAGTYPFRGVTPWCRCEPKRHVCDGAGCRYLCIDLDAKNGETDIGSRVRSVLSVCWPIGLTPVVFSSRSGKGAHVFVFLDDTVTTRAAHEAGRCIAEAAGVSDRCDVIPSAEHYAGFGTLHALPFGPLAKPGGGVMFDSHLRPVPRSNVLGLLRWANAQRSPAHVIEALAGGGIKLDIKPDDRGLSRRRPRAHRKSYSRTTPLLSKRDAETLKAMRAKHPQFKVALATPPEKWKGHRSSRDSYLAGYMRRQGMSAAGVVRALMELPGTKAGTRGEDYAWALIEMQAEDELTEVRFAGQTLRPAAAKQQRQAEPWTPWDARVAPPLTYGETQSPWWREGVQSILKNRRSKIDGIVLAYLIDRYYRGRMQRRMFFCGRRELGRALRIPGTTAGRVVRRLAEDFPDVLRVVPGVPHPKLRLASGYYVPERAHRDSLSWYQGRPVRLHQGMLVCKQNARRIARDRSHQSQHALASVGGELPF